MFTHTQVDKLESLFHISSALYHLAMNVNFCPHCAQCKALKELKEKIKQLEIEYEEQQWRSKEKIWTKVRLIKEQGDIHGENYGNCTPSMKSARLQTLIFLIVCHEKCFLSAQTTTNEEIERRQQFEDRRVIDERISERLFNSLECLHVHNYLMLSVRVFAKIFSSSIRSQLWFTSFA